MAGLGASCPVVMISGFTYPDNEFDTPYRIIDWHACAACCNDVRVRFDKDHLWYQRHAGTPRQFECMGLIAADHIERVIATIPGFVDRRDGSRPMSPL